MQSSRPAGNGFSGARRYSTLAAAKPVSRAELPQRYVLEVCGSERPAPAVEVEIDAAGLADGDDPDAHAVGVEPLRLVDIRRRREDAASVVTPAARGRDGSGLDARELHHEFTQLLVERARLLAHVGADSSIQP